MSTIRFFVFSNMCTNIFWDMEKHIKTYKSQYDIWDIEKQYDMEKHIKTENSKEAIWQAYKSISVTKAYKNREPKTIFWDHKHIKTENPKLFSGTTSIQKHIKTSNTTTQKKNRTCTFYSWGQHLGPQKLKSHSSTVAWY